MRSKSLTPCSLALRFNCGRQQGSDRNKASFSEIRRSSTRLLIVVVESFYSTSVFDDVSCPIAAFCSGQRNPTFSKAHASRAVNITKMTLRDNRRSENARGRRSDQRAEIDWSGIRSAAEPLQITRRGACSGIRGIPTVIMNPAT